MRYFKFSGSAGFCGTDFEDFVAFNDNEEVTVDVLNDIAEDLAFTNAESYEYLATGWGEDFESEEERDYYYENVECGWKEISEEEYQEAFK